MECKYTIDQFVDEPIMLIDKHIGFIDGEGQGIDGAEFARELLYLDTLSKKRIQVWICSEGGIVTDAYNIIGAMLKSKTKVDTYCIGVAASAAANIFVAGRHRVMTDFSFLMFHNPYSPKMAGKLSPEEQETINTFTNSLVTLFSQRTGIDKETAAAIMEKETWFTPEQALAQGLCDEIEQSSDQNKKRAVGTPQMKEVLNTGSLHLKTIVNKFKQHTMLQVTNKLQLNKDADEASIVGAISKIENRAQAAEERATTAEESLKTAQESLASTETKLTEITNKYNALVKQGEDAAKELQKTNAEKLVSDAGEAGKFDKNDTDLVAHFTKLAIADYEGTKTMFEKLGMNKKSPVVNTTKTTTIPGGAVAAKMAQIQARVNKN